MRHRSGGSTDSGDEITSPSISIVPAVGARKPAIIRSVVVLPQPDGPSSETSSPSSSARLKSSTAVTPPNARETWRSTRLIGAPSACGRSRQAGRSVPFGAAVRGRSCRGPAQHEVAAEEAKADQDQRDRDDDEDEADRRQHLEVAFVALVEQQHREHLGVDRVEEDRRAQLARAGDEDEDERAREAAL